MITNQAQVAKQDRIAAVDPTGKLREAIQGVTYLDAHALLEKEGVEKRDRGLLWGSELKRQYVEFAKKLGFETLVATPIKPFHRYELKRVGYDKYPGQVSYYHNPKTDEVMITHEHIRTDVFELTRLYDGLRQMGYKIALLESIYHPGKFWMVALIPPVKRTDIDKWFWRYNLDLSHGRMVPQEQISVLEMLANKPPVSSTEIVKIYKPALDKKARVAKK